MATAEKTRSSMYSDCALIAQLREYFAYDADTGELRWKKAKAKRTKVGAVAGVLDKRGYRYISFNYTHLLAHRVAWAFTHGSWPQSDIDHINGNKADNRLANLRDVSRSVNLQNQRRAHRASKAGLLGVSPLNGKFAARIFVAGTRHYLGLFDTPAQAHEAYLTAKRELHAGCAI